MANDYAKALGAKLRTVRNQQGLSLQAVEAGSAGKWKAVVVGSYERGDRAVTVQRLYDLAEFYGVPLVDLLPESGPQVGAEAPDRLVVDLEALAQAPADLAGPLARFVASIQAMRSDDARRLLALRREDLGTLALIYDEAPNVVAQRLTSLGILNADARPFSA
jgi:transcriptional regulator with XRE-family HTH domain